MSKPLKIVMVTESSLGEPGGPVTHLSGIAEGFSRLGHQVVLFAPALGKFPEEAIFEIKYVPTIRRCKLARPVFYIMLFFQLFFYLLAHKCNLLYTRSSYYTVLPSLFAVVFRIPHISELNGLFLEDLRLHRRFPLLRAVVWLVEKISYRLSDLIISVTENIRTELVRKYKLNPERVKVIPNGVRDFGEPLTPEEAQKRLNLPVGRYLIFSGIIEVWQGLPEMLRAFASLCPKYPGLNFLLVGDGTRRQEIEEEVRSLGISDRVLFTGSMPQSRAALHIQAAEIGLLHRDLRGKEFSPLKMFTYMTCGRPVVAADVPGLDLPSRENFGLNFPSGSVAGIEQALDKLLSSDKLRAEMGRRARELALQKYSWTKVAEQTLAYLAAVTPAPK